MPAPSGAGFFCRSGRKFDIPAKIRYDDAVVIIRKEYFYGKYYV